MEEEESDIEWMDSEPGPADSKPPDSSAVRASSSGAAAPKPPLAPGPLRQSSARPPSYPTSGKTQQKAQMADFRLQHASTIGRHQAAADTARDEDKENPELALRQSAPQGGSLSLSPTQHQGWDSSSSQQHASMQSKGQELSPKQTSPGHTSPKKHPSQPASPITSPFKKVPSPWEKDRKAAPQGSPTNGPHQISLPSAPHLGKSLLLGKRKHGDDAASKHRQGQVKQLQHIIARADDIAQDQTRDSVLLDTLNGVADDEAMPVSVEDRGAGVGDTAADNLKGRGTSPPKAAPEIAVGRLGLSEKAASQGTKGRLGTPQQPDPTRAEGKYDSHHQLGHDSAAKSLVKGSDSQDGIDMTVNGLPSSSQPVSFDNLDEDFEADLIAAVDKSSAEHASGGLQHTASGARTAHAAAAADADRSASGQQQHPAGSQAADIIHHHQQQQQQQSQVQEMQKQQLQQREGSAKQSLDASAGLGDSLPAPSELGLGEYGSAALGGVPSVGVSSALPSFDLDAEMDSLDKQTKVSRSRMSGSALQLANACKVVLVWCLSMQ